MDLPALPRRHAIAAGVAGAVAVTALEPDRTSYADAPRLPSGRGSRRFRHGVASGDPSESSVVLWTRVTPTNGATPGSGRGPRAVVQWEVARDPSFRRVVRRGRFVTGAGRDHTVKLTVGDLRPATWYFYRFTHQGHRSRVGRTRTTPAPDVLAPHLRFGFVSCSNVERGWFNAYRHLAARDDLHAVIHLGDYLYEGATDDAARIRTHQPRKEIVSLADYRQRHAQYKADDDLQDLHAAYPMIAIWDDHETANDAWRDGAGAHDPSTEGSWARRRARGHRAYDEWMPARLQGSVRLGDGDRLFRTIRFGRLADLHLLDLRSQRDQQVASMTDAAAIDDPDRTITGRQQMAWLKDALAGSGARWQLVGNPVMIAPLTVGGLPAPVAESVADLLGGVVSPGGVPLNTDAWDGYTADRRELFDHIVEQGVDDVVFLTGDIHTGLAADLPLDKATYPVSGTAGVELVCASVTSDNFDEELGTPSTAVEAALRASNPHYRYANLDDHGYCVLDVTAARVQCDWWVVASRADRTAGVRHDASWAVRAGTGRLSPVSAPVRPRAR
ncbi:MAG: Alkaline phosphatase [Nocardioides sp.]|nr:Alkaline phosphatase [Nocardioides sp.]